MKPKDSYQFAKELGGTVFACALRWLVPPVGRENNKPCQSVHQPKDMPLDHYVSQVHLKKFYSPALDERMYAVRKVDLKWFTPNSKSVCRISDGSTNAYLRKDRAIEEFLKIIEPKYSAALDKLNAGKIDAECIYTIAGFVAYVSSCSPAAMRIQTDPLKASVEAATAIMDTRGIFPPPPPELGGASLTELLGNGTVKTTVDPKLPQRWASTPF